MAVAHVQFASQINTSAGTSVTVTLGSAPTAGNVLLFLAATDYYDPGLFDAPTGFTRLDPQYNVAVGSLSTTGTIHAGFQVFYRVAESGDGTSYTTNHPYTRYLTGVMVEVSGAGTPVVRSAPFSSSTGVFFSGQDATVQSTSYAFMAAHSRNGQSWTVTTPTGFTELLDDPTTGTDSSIWCGYDIGATTISDLSVSNGGSYLCGMLVEIPEAGTDLTPWDGENFVTVKPSGGSYTTFSAALADYDLRNGVYQTRWDSASNLSTSMTQIYPSANYQNQASIKRYVHVTVASAHRHSGVAGTGVSYTSSYICFQITGAPYARISHFDLRPAGNNEGVLVTQTHRVLLDNLIIYSSGASSGLGRGVLVNGYDGRSTYIANCVLYSPHDAYQAVLIQSGGSYDVESSVYIDHCSIRGYVRADSPMYVNLQNNWIQSPSTTQEAVYGGSTSYVYMVAGANNVHGPFGTVDPNMEADHTRDWIESSELTATTTTADAVIVTNVTSGSEDFTPVAATGSGSNVILAAGGDRQPTRPDSRVDLSLDIAGNARPTTNVDIGAFQISEGGAATGTPIKVWTGSAWVNVNNLSYYDGGWS